MKYKLETIPVWDAFDNESECPFCLLAEEAEKRYLDFFLGASVMAPEMRVEVNKTGFCPVHFPMLFDTKKNRHSLGLMTHTRLKESWVFLEKELKALKRSAGRAGRGMKGSLPGGGPEMSKRLKAAADALKRESDSCMICDRIEATVKRYLFTTLHLWKKDEEGFRERYASSKGFCRPHLADLLVMAGEVLPGKLLGPWLEATAELSSASGARLEADLGWYNQKFDYQNDEKPWGSSKDALERAVGKLCGKRVGE
jgi:hypothetical protein